MITGWVAGVYVCRGCGRSKQAKVKDKGG